MWLVLGLLLLVLLLAAALIALLARALVWRKARRLLDAGRAELDRLSELGAPIAARGSNPVQGSQTKDRRTLNAGTERTAHRR